MTSQGTDSELNQLDLNIHAMLEREALIPRYPDETTYTFNKSDITKAVRELIATERRAAAIEELTTLENTSEGWTSLENEYFDYINERLATLSQEEVE